MRQDRKIWCKWETSPAHGCRNIYHTWIMRRQCTFYHVNFAIVWQNLSLLSIYLLSYLLHLIKTVCGAEGCDKRWRRCEISGMRWHKAFKNCDLQWSIRVLVRYAVSLFKGKQEGIIHYWINGQKCISCCAYWTAFSDDVAAMAIWSDLILDLAWHRSCRILWHDVLLGLFLSRLEVAVVTTDLSLHSTSNGTQLSRASQTSR